MGKVLGLIPARGGSTRVKRKNIKVINGDPLIAWTINDLLDANKVTDVYVTTNNKDIKEVSESYGAKVIDRPPDISDEHAQLESAISHAYNTIGKKYDYILTCQPTTPFRASWAIDKGIDRIEYKHADSCIYVCNFDRYIWHPSGYPINYDYKDRARSQDKEWELIEYGDYLCTPRLLEETGNRIGGNIIFSSGISLSYFDIDTELDLKIVNGIAKELDLHAKND